MLHIQQSFLGVGWGDCFKFVSSSFVLFTFLMCVAHSAFFFGGGGGGGVTASSLSM